MVSKKGFTRQALRLAEHEGIGCLSLLPLSSEQLGFSIGDMWYGVIRKWINVQLHLQFDLPASPIPTFNPKSVRWQGKPVASWFLRELFITYGEETKPGEFALTLKFDTTRNIEVEGNEWPVSAITCTAFRIYKKKRKWVSWSGDAFFDWHTKQLTIPNKGTVVGSAVKTDLHAWPDYDGEIPSPSDPHAQGLLRAVVIDGQKWNSAEDPEVPDLENL